MQSGQTALHTWERLVVSISDVMHRSFVFFLGLRLRLIHMFFIILWQHSDNTPAK